tara:strand:+ start:148 stop:765 length:618 start_codon:yes stop_codon:yes gene_type:complete
MPKTQPITTAPRAVATIGNIFIHSIAEAQLDGSAVGSILKNPADRGTTIEIVKDAINASDGVYCMMDNQDLFLAGNQKFSKDTPEDMFRVRMHRGEPIVCLRREQFQTPELKVSTLACIVYTKQQMLDDPQVTPEDKAEIESGGFEYGLVTFIASAHDEPAAVSSHRFVRNLAGGNADYENKSTEVLIKECTDIVNVEQEYMRVG